MPVFNAERYVEDAIQSILNQSFRDFELILINDGSTDNSLYIMSRFAASDSRIKLISRENRGLVNSLNEGISIAKGHWIARMDGDDISHLERLRSQLDFATATNSDICGTWIETFGSGPKRVIKHSISDQAIRFELLFDCPFAHPSVLIKADIAKKNPYSENYHSCEDYDLWERLSRKNFKMSNVPSVLLKYRVHSDQISAQHARAQLSLSQSIRHRYWVYFLDKHHINISGIPEVIKLRYPQPAIANIDLVDCLFSKVLAISNQESKEVTITNIKRLYFRVASNYPDIASRWKNLQKNHSEKFDWKTYFSLYLICKLNLNPENIAYRTLKKTYFYLFR